MTMKQDDGEAEDRNILRQRYKENKHMTYNKWSDKDEGSQRCNKPQIQPGGQVDDNMLSSTVAIYIIKQ